MIALIDYGAGNLASVRKALTSVGADVFVPDSPSAVHRASAIIIPGVGHFAATARLTDEWREAILESVERGRSLLGICLGMQWLYEGSAEAEDCPGLGLISGWCERLPDDRLKVPHVGWNRIAARRPSLLLEGLADDAYVYFTHAYAAPVTPETTGETHYGRSFASVVERGSVFGAQFHPEKSGETGLAILRRFLALSGRPEGLRYEDSRRS